MSFNPTILQHPTIPTALHGVNPRSVFGAEWWNFIREESYAKHDGCCHACGTHKSKARFQKRLEAHECYYICPDTGRVEFKAVVSLCVACHKFIHSGRLFALYTKGAVDRNHILYVLSRGFKLLSEHGLEPFWGTKQVWMELNYSGQQLKEYYNSNGIVVPDSKIAWNDWVMIIDGKEYHSKFKNHNEWYTYYNK